MIISLSGKGQSGKDLTGTIIQYLTSSSEKEGISFNEYQKRYGDNYFPEVNPFEVKKYSDKLKDMVCILIGCTREDLEDQEFKSTPLGDAWNRWRLDTTYVDEVLDSEAWNQDNNTLYFSSKESAVEFAEHEKKMLHIPDDKKRFGNSGDYSYEIEEEQLTPRDILQKLGTDFGRDMLHPDVWVNSLFSDYHSGIKMSDYTESKWIITDSRFSNDVERVKSLSGICIRVNRDSCNGRSNEHFSETALDNYKDFDYIIDNNGSIEDLIEKVREMLTKEGII